MTQPRLPTTHSFLFLSLLGMVGAGCSCKPPPVSLDDGGTMTPECVIEADCALGLVCTAGVCQAPVNTGLDGSTGCTVDADCPQGGDSQR